MANNLNARVCVSGGGPAGLMLGFLLAKAGIDVIVLEKHRDFLRDFRGDTIHPSTMTTLEELGLLDEFLKLPHEKVSRMTGEFGLERIKMADFSKLNVAAPYIAMIPQWDFLNFLAAHGRAYPNFRLLMNTEATDVIHEGGRIAGVKAIGPEGPFDIHADLVVAADGRWSILREAAGLKVTDKGAPIDVLWFRLSRHADDSDSVQARFDTGRVSIALNRGDYWQCAFVIAKGANEKIREAGLDTFRATLANFLPFAHGRTDEIQSWDQVKLLSVQVNRLETWWRPGFLCIGDAAHAMSPVGGVGINLAIQDAVAAANILASPLREAGTVPDGSLEEVQNRRLFPARVTQRLQILVQSNILAKALNSNSEMHVPVILKILLSIPGVRDMPARLLGLGVRPEHISADLARHWSRPEVRPTANLALI